MKCKFCDNAVTSTNPEVDYCRECYYSGHAYEERYASLLDRIDPDATFSHTGGGCFVIAKYLSDGSFLWASADGDGGLPEDMEGPWWLFRYLSLDVDPSGDDAELIAEHCNVEALHHYFSVVS